MSHNRVFLGILGSKRGQKFGSIPLCFVPQLNEYCLCQRILNKYDKSLLIKNFNKHLFINIVNSLILWKINR